MLTKRQKIAISSVILATSLYFLPTIDPAKRTYFLLGIIFASYLLSVWSIYYQFAFFELVSLFVLPVTLTASFGLFLSRFATSQETRFILSLVYIGVMYTILLSENIFGVSIERNIPLVRAARTVGYLTTLFVSFSIFTLLFGLRLHFFVFAALAASVASLLFAQGLWQIELKETNLRRLVYFSLVAGLVVGEITLAISFWPLDPPKMGLAATAAVYVILGLLQHYIREDLTRRTLFEYLFVGASVVLLLAVSTSWGV
jgi:hypothetical protein